LDGFFKIWDFSGGVGRVFGPGPQPWPPSLGRLGQGGGGEGLGQAAQGC